MTDHGTPVTEMNLDGGHRPPKPAAMAALSWVVALECWVNEGGGGDDPDNTAWLRQGHVPLRRQER